MSAEREPTLGAQRSGEWTLLGPAPFGGHVWQSGPVRVVSSLDMAELPDGSGEIGPQWQVSVSRYPKRPKSHDVRRVLRAFGLEGAEEDNHHSGVARHFFMPVDPSRRVNCECKANEDTIVERDGYTWTNPKSDEAHCRGCELRTLGRHCPIHDMPSRLAR